jgi:hypothetical protein
VILSHFAPLHVSTVFCIVLLSGFIKGNTSMSGTENLFPTLEARESAALPQKLALELQSGLMVCAAVNAAVQLGLPDLLAQPLSVTQVAREQELHEPSLLILLRALASMGIFTETTPETFGPTERSTLLRNDGMAALVRLWGAPYQWDSWKHLAHTIKTGRPGLEATSGEGTTIWTYLSDHPEEAVIFQQGLAANARLILPALLASYDFSGIKTLADIGGGFGELGTVLLSTYPAMEVTLFDRKEVIEQVMAHGISPQIHLKAGDSSSIRPPRWTPMSSRTCSWTGEIRSICAFCASVQRCWLLVGACSLLSQC